MSHELAACDASTYWEHRAQRFAAQDDGLAAVCAYGMPGFYNQVIHLCQRLALDPLFSVRAGARVLDVGCGVGRWSRMLAARGAIVTGIDVSPTMIAVARDRAASSGLAGRCRFLVQDLAQLDAGGAYDLIVGVTVLQHILDPVRLQRAVARMTAHLAPGGRMVLLEAAPTRATQRCNSGVFVARERRVYLDLYRSLGLRVVRTVGVDPTPLKIWLLPHLRHWPRAFGRAAVTAASALSLPVDALLGRWAVARSWHAVFVLEQDSEGYHAR